MSKLLRTVSFASANLKMLAIAIVLVLCGANDAFAQPSSPSIDCPDNVVVGCVEDMSDFDLVGWVSIANAEGYDVNVTYSDDWVNPNGNPCRRNYNRVFVVTFTNEQESFSLICTQSIKVRDFQAPTFVNAPENVAYQCPEEVPAMTNPVAVDRCGGPVVVEPFGSYSTADDTLVCDEIITPLGPGLDAGLWVNGLYPAYASTDWYRWVGSPTLVFSNDGQARLVGDVVAVNNTSNGWHVDITLADGQDWSTWSAEGGLYMDNLGMNASTHTGWNFYKLVTTISRLEGFGAYEGDQLILSHQPANYAYGFQFGMGANNRNGNNGGSGWFFYSGHVNGQDVNGHGDLYLEMGCENPNQPNEACEQTITRRWAATDACNNVSYYTQTISVEDTTAPTFINCPSNINVQCSDDVPAPVSASDIQAADNCTGDVVVSYFMSDTAFVNSCVYTITHIYTASDVCGNRSTCSYSISVNDNIAPELTVPASYTVECNYEVAFESAFATDNCTNSLNIAEQVDTIIDGCIITYVRSFSVSDDCGNISSGSQTINVIDTTAPVLVIPADYTVECNDQVVFADASASDNCSTDLVINVEVVTDTDGSDCEYTYTRIFSVSDACGNTTTANQVIHVIDTEAPAFVNLAGPYYVECNEINSDEWTRPAATDNCDEDLSYSHVDEMTSGGCLGTIHRTVTVSDNCGNSTSREFVIYIQDTTAPVITSIPADATAECSSVPSVPSVDVVEAYDNCGDASAIYGGYTEGHNANVTITVEQQMIPGNCPGNYTILWIWTATDYCENSSSATTTITVVDTTAPVFIDNPANITIDCGQPIPGAEVVTAIDNCSSDAIIAVSSDVVIGGSCAGQYLIERIYTATDACGNSSTFTQNIFVEDTHAPVFNTDNLSSFTYECDEDIQVVTPVAVDDCSGVSTQYTDSVNGGNCATYITRTWTATDGCGNQSYFVQNIAVLDTEEPVISFEAEINRPCDDAMGIYATATDNCDSDVEVVWVGDDLASGACAGRIVRTYSATDDCGNSTQVQQIITLIDTTAPVAINQPQDITVECGSDIPAYDPSWADNCSNELTYSIAAPSVAAGCNTIITETYTATDVCGNSASVSRTITIIDTTNPVIVGLPSDVTIDCGDDLPSIGEVEAYDNCDQELSIAVEDVVVPGNCAGSYLVERIYRVSDDCGNQSVASQNIYVTDSTAPIFNADNESIFTYECNESIPVITPVAVDNCSGVALVYSDDVNGDACDTYITRVWTATDGCGNQSYFTQNISISDSEAPVFVGSLEIERPCNDYQGIYVTAIDNCSEDVNLIWIVDEQTQSGSCAGEIVRTYAATDDCGNYSEFIQIIQLVDETAPVCINAPGAITIECGQDIPAYFPIWEDNCDVEIDINNTTSTSADGCNSVITTTYTATDDCGNTGTVVRVVNVVDTTAPVASNVPANQTIECSQYNNGAGIGNPTFTDNCDGTLTLTANVTEQIVGCSHIFTYIWSASDACGNTTSVTVTVNVYDQSNPVFTSVPVGGTYSCDGGINFGLANAIDACGNASISHSDNIIPSSCPQTYTIVRTWTATDACGNTANATTVYNVVDNSAPVFTSFPADMTVECDASEVPSSTAVAEDNCDDNVSIIYADELVAQNNCSRTIERTFIASDACGNSTSQVQAIYVIDTTAPVFSGDATISISCDEFSTSGVYVSATDNCGNAEITIMYDEPTGEGCAYSVVRHYSATDDCQNSSYFNQTIVVTDTQAPVASIDPMDMTYSCSDSWSAASVIFTDNCDADVSVNTSIEEEGDACQTIYHYTWIATDDCGNTNVVDQYITVLDETAPVFDMENTEISVQCGTEVTYPEPTATDNCGSVSISWSETIVPGNCSSNYTNIRTYTATDICGNSSSVNYTVNYFDTAAPEWSIDNVAAFYYECDETADVVEPVAVDNCSSVDYLYTDGEPTSNGCTYSFVRSWVAVDACGNASTAWTQTIYFQDTTDPELVGCPGDLTLACDAEVPTPAQVSATDNCSEDVEVVYEETCIGCPSSESTGYNLFTPARSLDNPCNYPYDWAMALFSLPSVYRWYQLAESVPANYVENGDGSITVTGRVFNVIYPDGGFDFNVTYTNGKTWAQWSSDALPSGFKADCGGLDSNYADWMYYILQGSSSFELVGWGSHAGSLLNLTHAPSNQYFGFQVGEGANNYNDDYGAGGWFNYSGIFLYQGQPVSSGLAGGIGDFAFGIENCPEYSIVRTWTAFDCAGNSTSCSQTINFTSQPNGFAGMNMNNDDNNVSRDEEISIVGIQPNPANNHSTITFVSTADGNLTLEVLDMTGRIVGNLFNRAAEAGVVYTADFNADQLSSGIYMVRLSSGTTFQIERLQIQK